MKPLGLGKCYIDTLALKHLQIQIKNNISVNWELPFIQALGETWWNEQQQQQSNKNYFITFFMIALISHVYDIELYPTFQHNVTLNGNIDCYNDIGIDYNGTVNWDINDMRCNYWLTNHSYYFNKQMQNNPQNWCRNQINQDFASNKPFCFTKLIFIHSLFFVICISGHLFCFLFLCFVFFLIFYFCM